MKTKTLKQIRKERGLTQKEAARQLGINICYLSRIENNERNPSDKLKNKMAKIYKVSSTDIFLSSQLSKC